VQIRRYDDWLLRGPQGQVRATASGDSITGHAGYNAWGGQAYSQWGSILPAYVDGDPHVAPDPSSYLIQTIQSVHRRRARSWR
jgi:hypothetical protein